MEGTDVAEVGMRWDEGSKGSRRLRSSRHCQCCLVEHEHGLIVFGFEDTGRLELKGLYCPTTLCI